MALHLSMYICLGHVLFRTDGAQIRPQMLHRNLYAIENQYFV